MLNFKIVIPGECPVKKNTTGTLWFRWINTGGLKKKIPLDTPIHYYSEPYQKWAREAVQHFAVYKNNLEINKDELMKSIPIKEPIFLSCIFFRKRSGIIDLSNLIEAPQDVLAGNAGNFLDHKRKIDGKPVTVKYNHELYQILSDDNKDIVKCLAGSIILYDPGEPRTEIFISSFDLEKWGQIMRLIHPNLSVGWSSADAPKLQFDVNETFPGLFP